MNLDTDISKLKLDKEIVKKLKEKNIFQVGKLCKMKRKQLLELKLTTEIIKQIEIKLQLQGLDISR